MISMITIRLEKAHSMLHPEKCLPFICPKEVFCLKFDFQYTKIQIISSKIFVNEESCVDSIWVNHLYFNHWISNFWLTKTIDFLFQHYNFHRNRLMGLKGKLISNQHFSKDLNIVAQRWVSTKSYNKLKANGKL